MKLDNNRNAFLGLLKVGLWEKEAQLSQFGSIDFYEVYRLAEEQSVVGLIAAAIEKLRAKNSVQSVPQPLAMQFAGQTIQLEQRNKTMNEFVAELIWSLRKEGIYALLLKGQGIAQCYDRPLWRAAGDVDLFLSEDNYGKARKSLAAKALLIEEEDPYTQHVGMKIGSWEVELHGNLRGGFSSRADKMLDVIKSDTFYNGNVRSWLNGSTQVFMLSAENDVMYVFTHILHHFFRGGIGLRQICDWCRLLYTYKESLNQDILLNRIQETGLKTEWRAFAALAVDYLGMPEETMPFYSTDKRWRRKAKRIMSRILQTGNFGHNIDNSFRKNKSFTVRKAGAVWSYLTEAFAHFWIFPIDSLRVLVINMKTGLLSTLGMMGS